MAQNTPMPLPGQFTVQAPISSPTAQVMPKTETPPSSQAKPTPTRVSATPAASCDFEVGNCILDGHFLMQRPIGTEGKQSIERSYPYGSTQGGKREPHHGVELSNAQGTPVLAVSDGKVVFAGDDKNVILAWVPAYYGKVIVLEHHLPGFGQAVYSLYAHLYKIEVQVGQQVAASEQIGQVGSSGTAIGSHLHFEVRLAINDYKSNRNPELWLATLPGTGVLAGHIEDTAGHFLTGRLNLQRVVNGVLDPLSVAGPETYATKERQPVGGDDVWHESFCVGELKAGDYRLSLVFNGTIYEQMIKIEPGRLTLVRFVVGR
jgi:murein DD-endopeptidase MepM/ murein hydrolase activator NlpD